MRNLVHFLLARLAATLRQTLLGGHAADVIGEHEFGGEYRSAVLAGRTAAMHGDVQAPGVVLVADHFDVLQEADELDETPAEPIDHRLDEDQLQHIDDEETTRFGAVLEDDRAGDEVTVVCAFYEDGITLVLF